VDCIFYLSKLFLNLFDLQITPIVGIINDSVKLRSGEPFYGFYCAGILKNCWINGGEKLVLNNTHKERLAPFVVDLGTKYLPSCAYFLILLLLS
jgi:hypothetical protein